MDQEAKIEVGEVVRTTAETLIPAVLAIFCFSMGFFNSFEIPDQLNVGEAVYLFTSMIIPPLSEVFRSFSSSLIPYYLILLGFFVALLFRQGLNFIKTSKKAQRLTIVWHAVKKTCQELVFAEIVIIILFGLIAWLRRWLEYRDSFVVPEESWLFLEKGQPNFIGKLTFEFSIAICVLIPAFTLPMLRKLKGFSKRKGYKLVVFWSVVVLAMSIAYNLGAEYSGNFLYFPKIRFSTKSDEIFHLIWRRGDISYVVNCDKRPMVLLGMKGANEVTYAAHIDFNRHSGVCSSME
jgi:hypothetical protein